MEVEAIRGLLARYPGPYDLQMADGTTVRVVSPKFILIPPEEVRDPRTIVVYGPGPGQFKLLDVLMIVAAAPAPTAQALNGHS